MPETKYKELLDRFYHYLLGIIRLHQGAVETIKEELAFIQSGDIEALYTNLSHQQIFIYKTKNFDDEVTNYMKELNLTGESLSQAVKQMPKNEQKRFYELIAQFELVGKDMLFYKEKCQSLLETRLHVINKNIAKYALKSDKKTYSQDGKQKENPKRVSAFEKNI